MNEAQTQRQQPTDRYVGQPNMVRAAPPEVAPQGMLVGAGEACGRQSAKNVLRQRIESLRREAGRLEALAQSLPEVLPVQADEALWDLLLSKR